MLPNYAPLGGLEAYLSGFGSSVSMVLSLKLRGPGFKSWSGTVGDIN